MFQSAKWLSVVLLAATSCLLASGQSKGTAPRPDASATAPIKLVVAPLKIDVYTHVGEKPLRERLVKALRRSTIVAVVGGDDKAKKAEQPEAADCVVRTRLKDYGTDTGETEYCAGFSLRHPEVPGEAVCEFVLEFKVEPVSDRCVAYSDSLKTTSVNSDLSSAMDQEADMVIEKLKTK